MSHMKSLLIATLACTSLYANDAEVSEEIAQEETQAIKEEIFSEFSGRIVGNKVRLRLAPDIESPIVSELSKDDLFVVKGEHGDFWIVEALEGMKAYVFRSFILDGVVEGNRVNVRLSPDLEAPVIAHLNMGEKIEGKQAEANHKWYEINAPESTRFYVAKEYVENIGGPEVKRHIIQRRETAEALVDTTLALAKDEFEKPFNDIDMKRITNSLKTIINDFKDFPQHVEVATQTLISVQEQYLQKKIEFLEAKANGKTQMLAADLSSNENASISLAKGVVSEPTDKMLLWEPKEEQIYLQWVSNSNDDSENIHQYYESRKASAIPLKGILEAYTAPVKNKPGDYILRENGMPVAYVYSTQVNLESFVGKEVSLMALPRSNNNFAFPAYFVLSMD